MRNALLVVLLSGLILAPATFAEEDLARDVAVRMVRLAKAKANYEVMLRDAKTETAAKYFVERIERIEDELEELGQLVTPPKLLANAPLPAPLIALADRWLRAEIRTKVAEKDVGLGDVTAWTRRELPERFFTSEELWSRLEGTWSGEDARRAWERRERHGWSPASFGSGTFIIRPSHRVARSASDQALLDQGKKLGEGGLVPKPLTRDQWWERASTRERTDWILAFFVRNSGLFETAELEQVRDCPRCAGAGVESKTLSGGTRIAYLCTRCAGVRHDITIRYR